MTTNTHIAAQREAFEASMRRETFDNLHRLSNGDYESYEARVGWVMWQAAIQWSDQALEAAHGIKSTKESA